MTRGSLALWLILSVCSLQPILAGPLPREKVPEPLKPRIDWSLKGHEQELCPFLQDNAESRHCAWPARLMLTLDGKSGRFTQDWHLDRDG